jgi:hypothetical protein
MPTRAHHMEVKEVDGRFRNTRLALIAVQNGRAQLDLNVLPFPRPFPSGSF